MKDLFKNNALVDSQSKNLKMLEKLSGAIFNGIEQLSLLQLSIARSSTEQQINTARKLLTSNDPQTWADLQTTLFNPMAQTERFTELSRQTFDVLNTLRQELAVLTQEQISEAMASSQEYVEKHSVNVPASTEPMAQMMKTAFENTNALFSNMQEAAQQIVSATKSAVNEATEKGVQVASEMRNQAQTVAQKATETAQSTAQATTQATAKMATDTVSVAATAATTPSQTVSKSAKTTKTTIVKKTAKPATKATAKSAAPKAAAKKTTKTETKTTTSSSAKTTKDDK